MKGDKEKYNFYLLLLFSAYCVTVAWLLFFQLGETERSSYFTSRKLHYIPFESTFNSIKLSLTNNFEAPHKLHYRYITVRNIIGNILLFMPWGILTPILFHKTWGLKKVLFSAATISVCVEVIQFVFVIGVADVDDVILNILGASVGFYLFLFLKKLKPSSSFF